jgi:tripartite-type tricarboxylate transporter receptor subunit TctC
MKKTYRAFGNIALSAAIFAAMPWAWAQTPYPSKAITLVVAYPAGGSTDFTGRLMATELAKKLGQPVVVDNVGGSGGTIGALKVASAKADGYTLFLGTFNELVGAKAIRPSIPYDGEKDFTPIGMIGTQPGLLLASKKSGVRNLNEFVSTLKSKPGKMSYGSPGVGSALHLSVEMAKAASGTFMVHIPYRGVAPLANDLLGDNLDFGIFSMTAGMPHVKSGKLIAIGTTEKKRTPATQDIPALAEHPNLKSVDMTSWFAVLGPAKLPADVKDKLKKALDEILLQPDVIKKISESGTTIRTDLDLSTFIAAEGIKVRKIVKFANITE